MWPFLWKLLFLHQPERPDGAAEEFVQDLGEAGVDGGGAADDAFVAGKMLESGAGAGVIADGEEEKEEGERAEYELRGAGQFQGGEKHDGGENSPH